MNGDIIYTNLARRTPSGYTEAGRTPQWLLARYENAGIDTYMNLVYATSVGADTTGSIIYTQDGEAWVWSPDWWNRTYGDRAWNEASGGTDPDRILRGLAARGFTATQTQGEAHHFL